MSTLRQSRRPSTRGKAYRKWVNQSELGKAPRLLALLAGIQRGAEVDVTLIIGTDPVGSTECDALLDDRATLDRTVAGISSGFEQHASAMAAVTRQTLNSLITIPNYNIHLLNMSIYTTAADISMGASAAIKRCSLEIPHRTIANHQEAERRNLGQSP
ncbi:uncharacterized protein AB675_8562 [Cyphellophora attinorum]|uniref:Uncharacterized protein n=1 Tax=Cyphellophora attinorum TaxID=1664694 RepID=A0A0N1HFG6_9EURO|nr:uncharacterized protein AB675_8562 [Phialophora attinorum]KPI44492.1 hypothetical protein AB675_8562 [Phialophora attinorum]